MVTVMAITMGTMKVSEEDGKLLAALEAAVQGRPEDERSKAVRMRLKMIRWTAEKAGRIPRKDVEEINRLLRDFAREKAAAEPAY